MKMLSPIHCFLKSAYMKALLFAVSLHAATAHAQLRSIDLSQDQSGGKDLIDVAQNMGRATDSGISLALIIFGFVGLIVTALSVYTIYKAGKDEREKPVGAIIGIFVGALMLAIPAVMWMTRNTVIGA